MLPTLALLTYLPQRVLDALRMIGVFYGSSDFDASFCQGERVRKIWVFFNLNQTLVIYINQQTAASFTPVTQSFLIFIFHSGDLPP